MLVQTASNINIHFKLYFYPPDKSLTFTLILVQVRSRPTPEKDLVYNFLLKTAAGRLWLKQAMRVNQNSQASGHKTNSELTDAKM